VARPGLAGVPAMIGRLVHSADFQRLLASPAWSRSAHFAIHHLPVLPQRPRKAAPVVDAIDLSTGTVNNSTGPVENVADRHWLGAVLPKRLARRAVTRNLLRRQIRAAVQRHAPVLPHGLWVVRLRAGFARTAFPAAASDALRLAARTELDLAFQRRRT
jgi:ribonuclease P protein component